LFFFLNGKLSIFNPCCHDFAILFGMISGDQWLYPSSAFMVEAVHLSVSPCRPPVCVTWRLRRAPVVNCAVRTSRYALCDLPLLPLQRLLSLLCILVCPSPAQSVVGFVLSAAGGAGCIQCWLTSTASCELAKSNCSNSCFGALQVGPSTMMV
jgi:hypothetical protein